MTMIKIREYDGDPQSNNEQQHFRHEYILSSNDTTTNNDNNPINTIKATTPNHKSSQRSHRRDISISLRKFFSDIFLPINYPHSVIHTEYLPYQIYDSIQGLSSYLRGVVTTSAILEAAGVGSSDANAMSAAVTWATRDGIGMIGGLLFSYGWSRHFDSHVKEFRLFADIINDVGLTLDMMAPLFVKRGNSSLVVVLGLSTLCKVMCGMSAGATKASITVHFAKRGNMADLNAKESTQETLVNLIGMTLGIFMAKKMQSLHNDIVAFRTLWAVFIILTIVHVWANYKGVKLLHLNTLNRERAELVLKDYIRSMAELVVRERRNTTNKLEIMPQKLNVVSTTAATTCCNIPSPQEISESLLSSTKKLLFRGNVHLGIQMKDFLTGISSSNNNPQQHVSFLVQLFSNERYLLGLNASKKKVYVVLTCGAKEYDELKAFCHAMIVQACLEEEGMKDYDGDDDESLIQVSYLAIQHLFETNKQETSPESSFNDTNKDEDAKNNANKEEKSSLLSLELLSKHGWDCNRLYLGFGPWRIDWNVSAKKED